MGSGATEILEQQAISTEIGTAVRHSFIYGMGGVLVRLLGFLLLPFFTHYLSPRDYGVLEILDTSMSLLGMFLNMGITAALLRYYGAAQTKEERRKVVGTVFVFAVTTGLLVFALGLAALPTASRLIFGPTIPPTYLLLSFTYFVLGYIGNIPVTYLRAKESSGRVVWIDTLGTLGILILSIVFLAGFKMAILGMLLSSLIVGCVKLVVVVKWMVPDMSLRLDWNLLRRILRFGAPLVFANLTIFILNFSDRFFLQRLASLEVVGIYALGYKFGYLLNFIVIQPFNMMWQARMYAVARRPDAQQVFAQVFALYSYALILAALGLSLVSREVVRLMVDPRYAAGAQVVGIVALAYVFLGIAYYVQLAMYLNHRTGLVGGVSAMAAVVNIGANYFFISRFGMMGAALATLIGFMVLAIGSYYCSERVFAMHLPVGRVCQGLCVAVALYMLDQRLNPSAVLSAIALKCLLLVIFAATLRLRLLSAEELGTLRSLWKSGASAVMRFRKVGFATT